MANRRRKPATTRSTTPPAGPRPRPQTLWREAGRRAVLGFAGSTGAVAIAVLDWWLRTR
ncbi:hypothetical protein [Streptomyces bauhiniae]|uniref:hypothetical protein n=1 Tax=Streptomyces bauhiniae TaxID=2340725 RepID=UPI00142F096B|nr:hypothetical protein [Streptomyces bauhiniae]